MCNLIKHFVVGGLKRNDRYNFNKDVANACILNRSLSVSIARMTIHQANECNLH